MLVVGAGVTGLTAAAVAAQRQPRVTVIDAVRPGALTSGHSTGDVQADGDGYEVETSRGSIRAGTVIIATGTPFLNRGMHFARLTASRSFVAALRCDTVPLRGMYLSVGDDTESLRPAHVDRTSYLIVAGANHAVGRDDSTAARVAALHDWTRIQFPGLRLTHSWAAQDYESLDSAPEIGAIEKGEDGILVATGFAKWASQRA